MTQTNEVVEHRLALVMNGGVSLAVWMGGVAREIDDARRASNGLPPPDGAGDAERKLHELWVAATARSRTTLTVDVIAGTSAGGLNGILLAAAAARGASLSGLRELWIEAGQMSADALFRPQHDPQSLMDGDFFHQKITEALERMVAQPEQQRRDVSLIVTATGLGQSERPVLDSSRRPFTEPDHRRRFHFSRHPARAVYRSTDGSYAFGLGQPADHFATSEPLATAARATASFPAAFAPVAETPLLRERRVFPDWQTGPALDWLADGGMLDNSPFQPVLETIQHKPVVGSWRRTLCYIDPSAAQVDVVPPEAGLPPSWLKVVGSAFSLPQEIDFRDGIDELHETIRSGRSSLDVRRFRSLTEGPDAASTLAAARQICAGAIVLYRQSSAVGAIYDVRDLIARADPDGYLTPALEVDKNLPLFFAPRPWLPAAVPAAGAELPTSWDWGVAAAERVLRTMLRSTSSAAAADSHRSQLSQALEQATAIGGALDDRLATVSSTTTDQEILTLLDDAYEELNASAQLASIVAAGATAYAATRTPAPEPVDVLAAALAVEVSNGAGSLPSSRPRPLFDFDRLGLDAPPPLLQAAYSAALGSPPAPNNILYGTRLHHFAAFARADWRRWDWLWGRLNALQHLAQILELSPTDVDELTEAIVADEGHDLGWVRDQIAVVMAMTPAALNQAMKDDGDLVAGADAALALLRSDPATNPRLPRPLVWVGQVASEMLARHGYDGNLLHDALRLAATPLRHMFWRMLGRGDHEDQQDEGPRT